MSDYENELYALLCLCLQWSGYYRMPWALESNFPTEWKQVYLFNMCMHVHVNTRALLLLRKMRYALWTPRYETGTYVVCFIPTSQYKVTLRLWTGTLFLTKKSITWKSTFSFTIFAQISSWTNFTLMNKIMIIYIPIVFTLNKELVYYNIW